MYYEPHPFSEIEKYINYDLRSLTKEIISNHDKPLDAKCTQIKEFVVEVMGKFKKKVSIMLFRIAK